MENYEPRMTVDESVAHYYNALRGDETAAVLFLEQLAKGTPALELAIGTGRIALPLAAKGIPVDGIDFSASMLAKLRAKPGADQIAVTLGDFADVGVTKSYGLIYVVYNSLFNLLSQDGQVRCFANVASHLSTAGAFVVEAFVPSYLHRLRGDQYVNAESVTVDRICLDVLRHDAPNQILEESHVSIGPAGVSLHPVVQRYAWPSELDLMARLAGLRLLQRWGGWTREPFTSSSQAHISVYGR